MFFIFLVNFFIFLVMLEEFKEGFKGLWKWMIIKKYFIVFEFQEILIGNLEVFFDNVLFLEFLIFIRDKEEIGFFFFSKEKSDKVEIFIFFDVEQFWYERDIVFCV